MRLLLAIVFCLFGLTSEAQFLKKTLKFATFYTAFSGNNSVSDVDVFSVSNGPLQTDVIKTPFDYAFTAGVRKIARFGYENRANNFYSGSETSYSDAATIGKIKGFEFLFQGSYQRQQGIEFLNQDHFLRYVGEHWIGKVEFLQDGFADVSYFEGSQRGRINLGKKLSLNLGVVQRLSEPYGYDPLGEWMLANNSIHYTQLAIQEGYNVDFVTGEFLSPDGDVVADNSEVWESVVVPQVIGDYVERKRSELPSQWNYSVVAGFDFYHFTKDFWLHSWANALPYHLASDSEFSYQNFIQGDQWVDYSGGLIFGWKLNKSLGMFLEGRYNKYWNREWHNFSVGLNYVII